MTFDKYRKDAYRHRFSGQLTTLTPIAGGVPYDPQVAAGWLKTKLGIDSEEQIREKVAETMLELNVTAEEAAKKVADLRHLNGFKRDDSGLYIEGRQLKAGIKEAASVALAAGKIEKRGWGATNKGLLGFVAEHIFVVEDRLHLGVAEPDGIMQRFISTFRGTGIQYEEYVTKAVIDFTVMADYEFTEKDWAAIWLTGEQQGIGASRSQGYGRYEVTKWEAI